jgi:chromosome segregation ATPase
MVDIARLYRTRGRKRHPSLNRHYSVDKKLCERPGDNPSRESLEEIQMAIQLTGSIHNAAPFANNAPTTPRVAVARPAGDTLALSARASGTQETRLPTFETTAEYKRYVERQLPAETRNLAELNAAVKAAEDALEARRAALQPAQLEAAVKAAQGRLEDVMHPGKAQAQGLRQQATDLRKQAKDTQGGRAWKESKISIANAEIYSKNAERLMLIKSGGEGSLERIWRLNSDIKSQQNNIKLLQRELQDIDNAVNGLNQQIGDLEARAVEADNQQPDAGQPAAARQQLANAQQALDDAHMQLAPL